MKFVHTNIIARDWKKLSQFYQTVFDCKPVGFQRDLSGEWLEQLTGLKNAHLTGEHLALPGYDGIEPTLEIFSYDGMIRENEAPLNHTGIRHIAFEVEDVDAVLEKALQEGGEQVGEKVTKEYPNNRCATFLYIRDIEGNIIELQTWKASSPANS